VLSQNPSTVIVWLGGNDILVQYYDRVIRGLESPTLIALLNLTLTRLGSGLINAPLIPIDETFENLETIVRRIQAEGAVVILVGFSGEPFNSSLESRFEEVAKDTGALYVPNALNGVIGRSSRMSDLIHPNNTGYGIVAERIYERFICVLEEEE
jgi:lysophospholipase L1-like esterase